MIIFVCSSYLDELEVKIYIIHDKVMLMFHEMIVVSSVILSQFDNHFTADKKLLDPKVSSIYFVY